MTDFDALIDEVEYYAREVTNAREWGMNAKDLDKLLKSSRTALREAIAEVVKENNDLREDGLKTGENYQHVIERLESELENSMLILHYLLASVETTATIDTNIIQVMANIVREYRKRMLLQNPEWEIPVPSVKDIFDNWERLSKRGQG